MEGIKDIERGEEPGGQRLPPKANAVGWSFGILPVDPEASVEDVLRTRPAGKLITFSGTASSNR